MSYWKTITTYLVDWNPTWIKTIELSNWIWKWIIIPRAKLKDAKGRDELNKPAVYFLFWDNEEWEEFAYIWEAENLINKIQNHDSNNKWSWNKVIAFISKDNNLTKADVKYLESKAIERAKKASRYNLQNAVSPVENNLPEYQKSAMDEFLDNIDLLISANWNPILKEIIVNETNIDKLYYCKWPDASATWTYSSEWFLVFKESKTRKKLSKTAWSWINWIQLKLLEEGVLEKFNSEQYIFIKNYLFKSPSTSAGLILSRRANWWLEWKDKGWKTLDDNERKDLKN